MRCDCVSVSERVSVRRFNKPGLGPVGDSLEDLSRNGRKLANLVINNPTDHFDNGKGRHNLGFVLKTPQDFGRLC